MSKAVNISDQYFYGKLSDGSYGVKWFKSPQDRLDGLIKQHGVLGFVGKKARERITEEMNEYYSELMNEITNAKEV